jgi:2-oxoacid:acceptor oxidoreductase delta subunit (pyruvate/2-ketoisovalerate family)
MDKPFAITLDVGSSLANHTGAWRTNRPQYVDRLPPCNHACPAGENIQGWLYHAEIGDYRAAWEAILADNPLPAIMGRACYHTCETACNRARIDEAVGIHAVERFLGDLAIREKWPAPPPAPSSGKRVLVVGAGPSGLSAAYHLARLGHAVTLRDAMPRPGGMMRYGIPRYRLPRDIVDAEIQRIVDLGVTLELGARVPNIAEAMARGFDACFAAVEIHGGLDEQTALFEARRCLSCGNCFECDNCYGVCPDNAVIKLGPGKRFEFNLDYCKGCGICVSECPCGAIKMVPETT